MAQQQQQPEGNDYIHTDSCVAGPGLNSQLLTVSASQQQGGQPLYASCKCSVAVACFSDSCTCSFAYRVDGRLLDTYLLSEVTAPIFECNARCCCDASCPNRASQRGTLDTLRVALTPEKGHGVFTSRGIPKGTFVGEYVGEILTSVQAKERLGRLDKDDPCYLVTFKEHSPSGAIIITNIDATRHGNMTRFINHSCAPNVAMVAVRSDLIVPRLCLFAVRDVAAAEEICFSYFGQSAAATCDVVTNQAHTFGQKPCLCGAKECRGFLPLEV